MDCVKEKKKLGSKGKTISIRKLKARVWVTFSRYIRTRDCLKTTGTLAYGRCFTCSQRFPFKQLQAGHFVAGRHNANLFSERGTQAQCISCNILHGGRPLEYRRQLIELYGEGIDEELEREANQTKKFTIQGLEELEKELKEKISLLESE